MLDEFGPPGERPRFATFMIGTFVALGWLNG